MIALTIDADPRRTYYQSGPRPSADLAHRLLSGISTLRRPLSIPGLNPAETPNLTADLDNARGHITAHYALAPPLRTLAHITAGAQTLFSGTITRIDLGEVASLQIEAGTARPLSDPLPLRNTTQWGAYQDPRPLPWAYGRVTLTPIRFDAAGRLFLLADHPIQSVVSVARDDIATAAWAHHNELDPLGHPVALLELAEPLAPGETLAVTLIGKMDATTGAPITSPARILWDLINHLAGIPAPWAEFDQFRVDTDHIALAGLIDDNASTARAVIDHIMQSVGAAWSLGMRGIATPWPSPPDPVAPALPVTPQTADDIRASAEHAGIATVLRILYDYDHAAGRHRRAIQLEAPEAIQRYGRLETEWPAHWLQSPRLAEILGRRLLAQLARPRWSITWRQKFRDANPGDWCHIDHPQIPITGRHRLLSADIDYAQMTLACSATAAVGPEPKIETTALAAAFEPVIPQGASVEYAGSSATFTLRNDAGQPLAGARAALNGTTSRIADAAGRVSFDVPRGRHVLYVEAAGYAPMEIEVTV